MFELIKNGGILMISIIICGGISIFIIAERIHYFISVKKRDEKLLQDIENPLKQKDYSTVETACVIASTPTALVIKEAINHSSLSEADLKEIVQLKMDTVAGQAEHLLSTLGTISNISTLLGLLGTVTGNIKAFGVLGGGGTMGDPAALANAIAQALVTTVGGLVVAIPSIIFLNYFNSQVNHLVKKMEATVTKVMFKILGKE